MEEKKVIQRYQSGQKIPENVLRTLFYVSKVGVLSTAQWHRIFGQGNLRWRQKQLKSMVDKKLIRRHTSSDQGFWVLSTKGEELINNVGRRAVTPASALQFGHDEFVGESMYLLEDRNICENWITEAECKNGEGNSFHLRTKDKKVKYPDAVFQVKVDDKEHLVALEYERIGKSFYRYLDILNSYTNLNQIQLIIYVVEDKSIRKRIEKAKAHLGSQYLNTRIAFANKNVWIKNPASCPLQLGEKLITLERVCTPYS